MNWNFDLEEALARCRYLGGPANQQALLTLLRRTQMPAVLIEAGFINNEEDNALFDEQLEEIAGALGVKCSFLAAIVRRYPSLRLAGAAHRLELCGGPNCSKAGLTQFVEKTYDVRPGGVSTQGNFSYHISGCQRSCRNGPCASWDGTQHTGVTPEHIRAWVAGKL